MKKKLLIASITALSAVVVGIMSYVFIQRQNTYHTCGDINDNLTLVEYLNGTFGIKNTDTGKITCRFDEILSDWGNQDNSSLIVVKNGLRGYVSATNGEFLFEPQFLYAWEADSDSKLAACVNRDYKLGFVNIETKEIAIPFEFDFDESRLIYSDWRGDGAVFDFVFKNGVCIVPGEGGKLGVINEKGKLILPIKYTDIINWRNRDTEAIILERPSFFEGVGLVIEVKDSKVYISDIIEGSPADKIETLQAGDVILKIKNENSSDYVDVNSLKDFDVSSLLRGKSGTKVNLLVRHEDNSTEDVCLTRDEVEENDGSFLYGICDSDFNLIVPVEYSDITSVMNDNDEQEDEIFYIVSRDGKYGVMDSSYSMRIPLEYDDIDTIYRDGLLFNVSKESKHMLLDGSGKLVSDFYIAQYYDNAQDYDNEDSPADFPVVYPIIDPVNGSPTGYMCYVFDYLKCGVIDVNRKIIIPPIYNSITYIGNGVFVCSDDLGVHINNIKKQHLIQ